MFVCFWGGWVREQRSFRQELPRGQEDPQARASPIRNIPRAQVRPRAGASPGQGQRCAPPARAVPCGAVWEEPAGSPAPAPPPSAAAFRGRPPRSRARGGMMDPRLRLLTPRARQPAVNGGGR